MSVFRVRYAEYVLVNNVQCNSSVQLMTPIDVAVGVVSCLVVFKGRTYLFCVPNLQA